VVSSTPNLCRVSKGVTFTNLIKSNRSQNIVLMRICSNYACKWLKTLTFLYILLHVKVFRFNECRHEKPAWTIKYTKPAWTIKYTKPSWTIKYTKPSWTIKYTKPALTQLIEIVSFIKTMKSLMLLLLLNEEYQWEYGPFIFYIHLHLWYIYGELDMKSRTSDTSLADSYTPEQIWLIRDEWITFCVLTNTNI
jgi:hypothetical protein